jgi:hypothetical protein
MKTRVVVGGRGKAFLEALAPEPRRKVWKGIKGLAQNRGDVKQLEGRLAPYARRANPDRVRATLDRW